MSAKNGLAVSFRARGRIIACSVAAICAVSAFFAASAGAFTVKENYLALGDSLAFGYSSETFNNNILLGDPAKAFEHGYPNDYWINHKYKENGIGLINNGCPGETTDSLIGNGPLGAAVDPTGETPCLYHTALHFPLHHEYGAGVSQLENALGTIAGLAAAGKPVTTISLNIGANDELHAIAKCEKAAIEKAEKGEIPFTEAEIVKATNECVLGSAKALFEHIIGNIGTIEFVLRNGSAFLPGGVNYAGKLIFIGSYDPYGFVYRSATEVAEVNLKAPWLKAKLGEILTGSLFLTDSLNEAEQKELAPLGQCWSNPRPAFNPGTHPVSGAPEWGLQGTLQKYTNMANQKTYESGPPYEIVRHDGPDIHPKAAGYQKMAKVMQAACG
jgi:lysophospholipase L1-like esterase